MWATAAQDEISTALNPTLLTFFNKKNMRSLTNEQFAMAERIKFDILCGLAPFEDISNERLINELATNNHYIVHADTLKEKYSDFINIMGREPTLEEIHQLQAEVYSELSERNMSAPYGYCPKCGAKGVQTERRPDGNTTCANGCVYRAKEAIYK